MPRSDHTPESQCTSPNQQMNVNTTMTGNMNYPTTLTSTFPTNNFNMNSSEMGGGGGGMGYNSWPGQSMMGTPMGSPMSHSQAMMGHQSPVQGMVGGHVSPMTVNTLSGAHIKSEPITPPPPNRDSTTPSGPPGQASPQPQHQLQPLGEGMGSQLSPVHPSPSDTSSSPVHVHNLDYGDSPLAKRSRMEGWTT